MLVFRKLSIHGQNCYATTGEFPQLNCEFDKIEIIFGPSAKWGAGACFIGQLFFGWMSVLIVMLIFVGMLGFLGYLVYFVQYIISCIEHTPLLF